MVRGGWGAAAATAAGGRFRYGVCPVCRRRMSLTSDGKISRRHTFCDGAGRDPEPLEGKGKPGMTEPRDIDLAEWLDGTAHHPPANAATVLAHQAARTLVAELGTSLFQLLPAGRDKRLAFTALEDVLMRANRAIALGGGPKDGAFSDDLRRVASAATPLGETQP